MLNLWVGLLFNTAERTCKRGGTVISDGNDTYFGHEYFNYYKFRDRILWFADRCIPMKNVAHSVFLLLEG